MGSWLNVLSVATIMFWFSEGLLLKRGGSCSSSSFNRDIGHILRGHVVAEHQVVNDIECRRKCIMVANCFSVNILKNAEGNVLCQLNSARKETAASEQFVRLEGGEYCGLKEKRFCVSDGANCASISVTPWYSFNQSYFRLVETPMTWYDARDFCMNDSGDLASISSEEEQQFLFKTFLKGKGAQYTFVALNDIQDEGVFLLPDRSPPEHIRFAPNEPNNLNNEDCLSLWNGDGGYNDWSCVWPLHFLCEIKY